jgi:hypothetical protein
MIFVARPIVNAMFKGSIHPQTKDIVHELVSDSVIGHTIIGRMLDKLEMEIRQTSEQPIYIDNMEFPFAKICNVMFIVDCPDITPNKKYPTTIRLVVTTEFICDGGHAIICPGVICEFEPPYKTMSEYISTIIENIQNYTDDYTSQMIMNMRHHNMQQEIYLTMLAGAPQIGCGNIGNNNAGQPVDISDIFKEE